MHAASTFNYTLLIYMFVGATLIHVIWLVNASFCQPTTCRLYYIYYMIVQLVQKNKIKK